MAAMATHIDGSVLEGGGQILRNGVSLSALLRKPVIIDKIRNGRKPPGLKNQHRVGLELAAQIASGTLLGGKNGSTTIEFSSGTLRVPGEYTADSVTAGSITLLLQTALPLLLFSPDPNPTSPSVLTLIGGTNATQAPQVDYTQHVFLPFLRKHVLPPADEDGKEDRVELKIIKRGYFPKGGGVVEVKVYPLAQGQKLRGFSLMERGGVKRIGGIAHYSKLPRVVGEGMADGAMRRLKKAGYGRNSSSGSGSDAHIIDDPTSDDPPPSASADSSTVKVDIRAVRESNNVAIAGGSGIVLWAELEGGGYIGGSAVGRKGRAPEQVGEEAADALIKGLESGGCVDEWLQDQIILFVALAEGRSEVRCGKGELELHTRTAIWLAEQMTDAKFLVESDEHGYTIIRCEGIGYTAPGTS